MGVLPDTSRQIATLVNTHIYGRSLDRTLSQAMMLLSDSSKSLVVFKCRIIAELTASITALNYEK